jgi:hypothetical protein
VLTFFNLFLQNMLCHGSLLLHLKLNSLNYYSSKAFCTIRSYQTPLTLATATRLPLSQMLSAPDQVLFQKKLTNFRKLLFIYNKSMKNGYYRSKKPKLFYLYNNIKKARRSLVFFIVYINSWNICLSIFLSKFFFSHQLFGFVNFVQLS